MKSHPLLTLIISIIFILIVFISITEGHTVWVHNKLVAGTWAAQSSIAHNGFHLAIPDNIAMYYLYLEAIGSTEDTKIRGPISNDKDNCWHFHGSLDDWGVDENCQ
ncbi:hypothetical protein C1646_700966 [Rhizophagus diaphanus]|nr:hypothetical protein C1646_700966 [Rhizophagus diaphanus] [Rhizophagus sp. MUCL 43196]